MKSLLRLVALVLTISLRAAKSKAPIICSFAGLPRRLDPQVAPPFCPSASEVGMGKGLRLVAEQQSCISSDLT